MNMLETIFEAREEELAFIDESYYFYKKYYFAGLKDGIKLKEEIK